MALVWLISNPEPKQRRVYKAVAAGSSQSNNRRGILGEKESGQPKAEAIGRAHTL